MTPSQQPKEQLVYSSIPWKICRQDAGMGEHDYAVFLNDVFFCRTEHSQTAHEIINAIRSRPSPASHTSAGQQRIDMLSELQMWRIRRMTGTLKKDVWIAWNEETDRINALLQAGDHHD